MTYANLGKTDLKVSKICLGTMTFGQQNSPEEAFAMMDMALEAGINFFDAAEMYPIPPRAETQGRTEEIIGDWLADRGTRDQVVLATKATGPGPAFRHLRGGPDYSPGQLRLALEGSLRRLRVEQIDLYQLHWPERRTNFFGKRGYQHDANDTWQPNFESILRTVLDFQQEAKIRHFGLSNETPWGLMSYLRASENLGLPRVASIQNPYSLLNRTFEQGLAEMGLREQVGLLAYSPLAFGMLTGKYLGGAWPANARLTLFRHYQRYNSPQSLLATERYAQLAQDHGLSLARMALAFVNAQPFVASNIIGATTPAQLRENISSFDLRLAPELLAEIEAIHESQPNPAP